MQTLKESIRLSARETWDDFWEPFYWFTSANIQQREPTKLRERNQTSPLLKIGVTIVSASLASAFIFFISNTLGQLIAFPTTSIALPALTAIWSIGLIKIVLVLLVQRKL
ncbi:hypothetical protein [Undibacterium sp. Xuan67W]|uniref:hypothetical protein n=1 Tax=Undibacterium sp. Xuan67W TaxID=3413057 RepID=UPI003BF410FD